MIARLVAKEASIIRLYNDMYTSNLEFFMIMNAVPGSEITASLVDAGER